MGTQIFDRVGLVDHRLNPQREEFLHPFPGDPFAEDNDLRVLRLRDSSEGSAEFHDLLPLWDRPEDHQLRLEHADLDPTLIKVSCHHNLMGVGGSSEDLFQESFQQTLVFNDENPLLGFTEKGI